MEGESHQTIMEQVKRGLTSELLDHAGENQKRRDDLFTFLGHENADISSDVYFRLLQKDEVETVIGRVRMPSIKHENPKPTLASFSPKGFYTYFKNWGWYFYMKLFLKALNRSLFMHDELQAMQYLKYDQKKSASSEKGSKT